MYSTKLNQFLCQTINQVHLRLIYYGRAQIDTIWRGKVHNPVYSRLFYIVSGSCCITVNETEKIVLEAGNWYLLPAGLSFEYSCDNSMDHLYFHFNLCDIDRIDMFHRCQKICEVKAKDGDLDFFSKGLDCRSVHESLQIRQRVYEILLELVNKHDIELTTRNLSPCVLDAIRYIKRNLSASLTTKIIAEHCEISPSTLNKHFRSELTMSVGEYIDTLLFSEASRLLRESNLLIMQISETLGFSDQFYFSRRFTEKMGSSPNTYRKTFV